jgi:hypothetical protein
MNIRRTDRTRIRRTPCSQCFDLPWRRALSRFGCLGCGKAHEAEPLVPAYQQTASPIAAMESW